MQNICVTSNPAPLLPGILAGSPGSGQQDPSQGIEVDWADLGGGVQVHVHCTLGTWDIYVIDIGGNIKVHKLHIQAIQGRSGTCTISAGTSG